MSATAPASGTAPTIDHNLYSRQLAVFGAESMGKLVTLDVLIVGMKGLGVETAKNLILAGPKSVTIFDPSPVTMADTGTNFYLKPEHVGAAGVTRAKACLESLSELNPYVSVSAVDAAEASFDAATGTWSLPESVLGRFDVVVCCSSDLWPRKEQCRVNAFCRSRAHAQGGPIGFISSDVRGLAGYCFLDFGPSFTIRDATGENTKSAVVASIVPGSAAAAAGSAAALPTVYTVEGKRLDLQDGDHVVFREVGGDLGSWLNDGRPRKIVNVKARSFQFEPAEGEAAYTDPSKQGEHTVGGLIEQVKVPFAVSYGSLEQRTTCPVAPGEGMLISPDLGKWGRSEQLHAAFVALEAYRASRAGGALPALRDAKEAEEVVALAKQWLAAQAAMPDSLPDGETPLKLEALEESTVRLVASLARTELPALNCFFGGVVAQEVVKATGKFTPLRQWLYWEAFDVLMPGQQKLITEPSAAPAAGIAAGAEEFAPSAGLGSRYDPLYAIFGRSFQNIVSNQRVFVVGAGALGCEFLKNYALMGVGCGGPSSKGHVTVTDMDRIETSNLNRQFLFRSANVGQPKSVTAAAAAQAMNGDFKVTAMETPVGEDTEATTFNDAFWSEKVDIVTNALDNLKARTYVDHRCVFYGKPLLESGTLGTKANTQVVAPYKTECYSDSVDPPEESIPMCTLRNFPHAIEHCIEWARDLFAGSFTNTVQEAASFVADPNGWLRKTQEEGNMSARRSKLSGVASVLKASKAANWHSCVAAARHLFNTHFTANVKQLLFNFPPDYADPATGVKFWSPPKRVPTALAFDPEAEPEHLAFIVHGAALVASNYGVPLPADWESVEALKPVLASIVVPEFVPKSGARIKADDADTTEEGADDDGEAISSLTAELRELVADAAFLSSIRGRLTPQEFEKDDDTNHHVAFITAASNLRAMNYRIATTTRFNVKLIAGKIIPAIATTTAAVTGLVAIEFYKTLHWDDEPSTTSSSAVAVKRPGAPVERLRNTFMNLAINAYQSSEPAPPKRTKSVAMDPISMGPVKAMPEGFTRWERIQIKGQPDMTPNGLSTWLGEHFAPLTSAGAGGSVRVSMISAGKAIIFNPLLYRNHATTRKDKPLRAIVEEVQAAQAAKEAGGAGAAGAGSASPSAAAAAPSRAYLLLDVSCEDDEGDVVVPQVQLWLE